jgi:hypothetical protein
VRSSFWNLLTFLFTIAGFLVAGVFLHIFNDPYSGFNPFPPPTPITTVFYPTLTASPQPLPDVWTKTPEVEPSPQKETTREIQPSITPVIILNTPTAETARKSIAPPTDAPKSNATPSQNSTPLNGEANNPEPAGSIIITAPVGVFNNTWQKLQSIPAFSWKVQNPLLDIKYYRVYFDNRMDSKPAAIVTKTYYTRPAVPSGEYYFRIEAVGIDEKVLDTSEVFVFKYDDTPPTNPDGFGTNDPSTTVAPYFTWLTSTDGNSGMEGGIAGYSIYQGSLAKCGKPVAFTTVPHWNPVTPLAKGTTEYFCVKAMDAVGNESKWIGPVPFTYSP